MMSGEPVEVTSPEPENEEVVAPPPASWLNWQEHFEGAGALRILELRLYSDADFVAEAYGFGPYSFLNTVARSVVNARRVKPGIVLRTEWHLMPDASIQLQTNDDHYHGGDLSDELAALAALLLDARIIAGPIDREFGPGEDPLGRPRGHDASHLPWLASTPNSPQIPRLYGSRDLRDLARLATLPLLTPEAAAALIKSARLFQNALWVADSTPETAWLLLVSAIETAANHWDGDERSVEERFALSYRGVIEILTRAGAEATIPKIARAFKGVVGATAKFVSFMETFAPGEPEQRPTLGRFDFSPDSITKASKRIYALRSRALHAGVPFPYPMCLPPTKYDDGPHFEVPGGRAASAWGATWNADDTPMLLHTFAYIVRAALLSWWGTMVPADSHPADPPFSERLAALGPVQDRFRTVPVVPDDVKTTEARSVGRHATHSGT